MFNIYLGQCKSDKVVELCVCVCGGGGGGGHAGGVIAEASHAKHTFPLKFYPLPNLVDQKNVTVSHSKDHKDQMISV